MRLMTEEQLGDELALAEHDLFRLESLDLYDVESDSDYADYAAGRPGPDMEMRAAWLDELRSDAARGLRNRRVHILRSPIDPASYLAYECAWGYVPNGRAGMEIRILDLAVTPLPAVLIGKGDFYVRDHQAVTLMHYSSDCRFLGASRAPRRHARTYLAAAEAAWEAAVPFSDWWAAHPEYQRQPAA